MHAEPVEEQSVKQSDAEAVDAGEAIGMRMADLEGHLLRAIDANHALRIQMKTRDEFVKTMMKSIVEERTE